MLTEFHKRQARAERAYHTANFAKCDECRGSGSTEHPESGAPLVCTQCQGDRVVPEHDEFLPRVAVPATVGAIDWGSSTESPIDGSKAVHSPFENQFL